MTIITIIIIIIVMPYIRIAFMVENNLLISSPNVRMVLRSVIGGGRAAVS